MERLLNLHSSAAICSFASPLQDDNTCLSVSRMLFFDLNKNPYREKMSTQGKMLKWAHQWGEALDLCLELCSVCLQNTSAAEVTQWPTCWSAAPPWSPVVLQPTGPAWPSTWFLLSIFFSWVCAGCNSVAPQTKHLQTFLVHKAFPPSSFPHRPQSNHLPKPLTENIGEIGFIIASQTT